MATNDKAARTKPRRLKGFRDITAADVLARDRMIACIRRVYERYGFVPLETPALEYVDALGKFLPGADLPQGGIFAFRDEEQEWVGLRYDLAAPLSRFVAMNPDLPKPYRRYQLGPVYRMEKPGPGRFREFYQFDFDSVGTPSMQRADGGPSQRIVESAPREPSCTLLRDPWTCVSYGWR